MKEFDVSVYVSEIVVYRVKAEDMEDAAAFVKNLLTPQERLLKTSGSHQETAIMNVSAEVKRLSFKEVKQT